MKKLLLIAPLIFVGCSFTQTSQKVTNFAKCYVHKIPAPFWVCYQSSFVSVGKVYTDKVTRLRQEEAYAKGVSHLVDKILTKSKEFLEKLRVKDKKIQEEIRDFIVLNAIETDTWYSEKTHFLYVKVEVNEKEFKRFLFSKLKNIDKKHLEIAFDETF